MAFAPGAVNMACQTRLPSESWVQFPHSVMVLFTLRDVPILGVIGFSCVSVIGIERASTGNERVIVSSGGFMVFVSVKGIPSWVTCAVIVVIVTARRVFMIIIFFLHMLQIFIVFSAFIVYFSQR